ncbi:hypothetical protein HYH03_011879 [Edaphochlamys debaryana]|uniref:Uncharacterized protein n=1 Tax=Edaphochlamys debaryana TaxID=47281 RepID=A0A836BVZ8_9CHLO|nr:hypothetical protein HYH03_011879 [Edaphochlamys debaryana]|eukprot:KAG2489598.1 hypothetical protein HYH03_011879 [Edaphochlamys debaryana]
MASGSGADHVAGARRSESRPGGPAPALPFDPQTCAAGPLQMPAQMQQQQQQPYGQPLQHLGMQMQQWPPPYAQHAFLAAGSMRRVLYTNMGGVTRKPPGDEPERTVWKYRLVFAEPLGPCVKGEFKRFSDNRHWWVPKVPSRVLWHVLPVGPA